MEIYNAIPERYLADKAISNILNRVSVRKYEDKEVSPEQLSIILHAAMSAPSGVNRQPWEFLVIDDRNLLTKLGNALPYAKMTGSAPIAIMVCGNTGRFLDGEDSTLWQQDLSAASENILLAAHALGLGAVWTCLYPHQDRIEAARSILNIPDNLIPFNLIPVGYPENTHHPMQKWNPERIHINGF